MWRKWYIGVGPENFRPAGDAIFLLTPFVASRLFVFLFFCATAGLHASDFDVWEMDAQKYTWTLLSAGDPKFAPRERHGAVILKESAVRLLSLQVLCPGSGINGMCNGQGECLPSGECACKYVQVVMLQHAYVFQLIRCSRPGFKGMAFRAMPYMNSSITNKYSTSVQAIWRDIVREAGGVRQNAPNRISFVSFTVESINRAYHQCRKSVNCEARRRSTVELALARGQIAL
ncbi:hypothetical protein, conserved [Eimeria maxima]|uniref:Uncharacterized protein n=1 Tax=Eimeria maxima TaxID=5804 RepID=U6MAK4_EIMMA|nr:hypothetical protein, conserved [Eimeria maxima]CDJ58695.1 hypothetical protein, conserved [Eimeria maxima]